MFTLLQTTLPFTRFMPHGILHRRFSVSGFDGSVADIKGMVEKILFRAPSGYTVAKIRVKGSEKNKRGKLVTVVSSSCPIIATADIGDSLHCQGTWSQNEKWGMQVEVHSSQIGDAMVTDAASPQDAMKAWLISGALKGVGPKTADRILDTFGEQTQEVFDDLAEPNFNTSTSPLLKVPGIGPKVLKSIALTLRSSGSSRIHVQSLLKAGIPLVLASKVVDYWGERALQRCQEDFHATVQEVGYSRHISFGHTDNIAKVLDCPIKAPGRFRHAVSSCLNELTWQQGHCFVMLPDLIGKVQTVLTRRASKPADDLMHTPTPLEVLEVVHWMAARHFLSIRLSATCEKKNIKLSDLSSNSAEILVLPSTLYEAESVIAETISARCAMPCVAKDEAVLNRRLWSKEMKAIGTRIENFGSNVVEGELDRLEASLRKRKTELKVLIKEAHDKGLHVDVETGTITNNINEHNEIPTYLATTIKRVVDAILALDDEVSVHRKVLGRRDSTPLLYPWETRFPTDCITEKNRVPTNQWDPINQTEAHLSSALHALGLTASNTSIPITSHQKLVALSTQVKATFGGKALSVRQAQAVSLAMDEKVFLLSGGPGVGKTETVSAIVNLLQEKGHEVLMACPTARAAHVLETVTKRPVTTIHRLLEWSPRKHAFERNEYNKLDAHTVIIDESSMLDVDLAAHLFRALRPNTRLILVGDQDQLPSVGPGSMYRDLMSSRCVPRVVLTEIFRQREDGSGAADIAHNAQRVNRGLLPNLVRSCLTTKVNGVSFRHQRDEHGLEETIENGCVLLSELSSDSTADRLVFAVKQLLSSGRIPDDIQVLSPMKQGPCGTIALNKRLQPVLNSGSGVIKGGSLAVGDRVIQLVNDYERGVFNGDTGRVASLNKNGSFLVHFEKCGESLSQQYKASDLNSIITLSYAVTVHKAQGSEYPVVLLPLVRENGRMLQRTLLYTGMSRAKELLVMLTTPGVVSACVQRTEPNVRRTRLGAEIASLLQQSNPLPKLNPRTIPYAPTPEVKHFNFEQLPF